MVLAAAVTGSLNGIRWALPAASAPPLSSRCSAASRSLCASARHWAAREVIAEGGERLPLAPVEHERRRLLAARTRCRWPRASSASAIRRSHTPRATPPPSPRPIFDVAVIADVAEDLRSTARRPARRPRERARRRARPSSCSPGEAPRSTAAASTPLRAELGRVRYLLEQ